MTHDYTVILYTPQDLNHSSYVHSGFFELEAEQLLRCKVRFDVSKKRGRIVTDSGTTVISNHPHQKTSYYKLLDHSENKEYFFATDLSDIPFSFSKHALDHCDFIFKRNYVSHYVNPLGAKYSKKIVPMGLTLGVQSPNRRFWKQFKIAHLVSNLVLQTKLDRHLFQRIKRVIVSSAIHRKYVTKGRSLDLLEKIPPSKELSVFYQVRCFVQTNVGHVQKLNDERAAIIRALKKGLDDKFHGGMVPGEVSNSLYKDCLTNLPTDPESYLNLIKNATICIYTNGLRGSPARKLPEYLSQAKCIVAQRFEAELPVPLEHGKHIMFFDTPEECVEICKQLLNDPDKVHRLSVNARSYFEEHVHPFQNVKRILEFILNKPLT